MRLTTNLVLEKCALLSAGGASAAECVAYFPDYKTAILEYFETTLRLSRVSSLLPTREASARGHAAMMNALRANEEAKAGVPRRVTGLMVGAVAFGALTVGAAAAGTDIRYAPSTIVDLITDVAETVIGQDDSEQTADSVGEGATESNQVLTTTDIEAVQETSVSDQPLAPAEASTSQDDAVVPRSERTRATDNAPSEGVSRSSARESSEPTLPSSSEPVVPTAASTTAGAGSAAPTSDAEAPAYQQHSGDKPAQGQQPSLPEGGSQQGNANGPGEGSAGGNGNGNGPGDSSAGGNGNGSGNPNGPGESPSDGNENGHANGHDEDRDGGNGNANGHDNNPPGNGNGNANGHDKNPDSDNGNGNSNANGQDGSSGNSGNGNANGHDKDVDGGNGNGNEDSPGNNGGNGNGEDNNPGNGPGDRNGKDK